MTPLDEVKGDPEVDFGTISGVGVNCVGRHARGCTGADLSVCRLLGGGKDRRGIF